MAVTEAIAPAPEAVVATRRRSRPNAALVVGATLSAAFVIVAVLAPVLAPADPTHTDVVNVNLGPSPGAILGTDHLGRDELSRLLHGARTSLSVALVASALGLIAGGVLGVLSAYVGGFVDNLLGRAMDVFLSLPLLIVAMAIVGTIGTGFREMALALAIALMPGFYRMIRGPVMSELEKEHVLAARIVGCGPWRIVRRHVLPQVVYVAIVQTTLAIAGVILVESALAYLGLGVPPPTPTWGRMLSEAQPFMTDAPLQAILPGLSITLAVLAFNLLGDGLRDRFDPVLRKGAKL